MTLPTFLVIGAAKSGTTALYELLGQHPQIFMSPVKETNFFAFDGTPPKVGGPGADFSASVLEPSAYRRLFDSAVDESARGEVSPMYMALAEVASQRIARLLPEVKLIAILRQPAERAYSSFLHLRRDGREPIADFAAALAAEEGRIAAGWGYLWRYRQLGHYAEQLRPYYARFPASQIEVCLYERLRDASADLLAELDRFLGVDPGLRRPAAARPNVSGEPRSERLAAALRSPSRARRAVAALLPRSARRWLAGSLGRLNLSRPQLQTELRRRLTADFHDQIGELEELTGLDCAAWLEGPG